METPVNYFADLYRVDVSGHMEKKNGFSYVSWPFAVAELRKRHPTATWEVVRYGDLPYQKTECGVFVEVAVTVNGVRLSQIHPVLDHANKPLTTPNAFHINTSIQRCLVKAIALHGLGLFVYAGEDLPEGTSKAKSPEDEVAERFRVALNKDYEGDTEEAVEASRAAAVNEVHTSVKDQDLYRAAWNLLDAPTRRAIKAYIEMTKTKKAA